MIPHDPRTGFFFILFYSVVCLIQIQLFYSAGKIPRYSSGIVCLAQQYAVGSSSRLLPPSPSSHPTMSPPPPAAVPPAIEPPTAVLAENTQFLISGADKLFASLRIRDTELPPQHDIAPSEFAHAERAKSVVALRRNRRLPPAAITPDPSRPGSPPPVDYNGLSWPSVGAKKRLEATPEEKVERLDKLSGA